MKAALISLGSTSSKWTAEAMRKYFDQVDELDLKAIEVNLGNAAAEILYEGKKLSFYDCVYLKGSFRYVQVIHSIASVLKNKCYMPMGPNAFSIGHDKLATHLVLQDKKIPMPPTYISSSPAAAKHILEKVNYPIVMKFPQGTQGKGVMFGDSFSSACSMLDALSALNQPVIIQQYVETNGVDIRAIVVGNKVVAAMKRKSSDGEKRANIHAGGKGEVCELDFHTKKIAIDTAESIDADICAVDILESVKGPLVIEVNLSPGLQGITKATGDDIADKIAKYLYDQTKIFRDGTISFETKKIMDDLDLNNSLSTKKILTNLDFRLNRILLPEIVTSITGFNDKVEVELSADKHSLIITKSSVPPKTKLNSKNKKK
ncbi:RimK family alpha-L-glutamate ligase [Candidatus Woesearchaeota archaeon]|jgi:ribosomal protein S6--L-glutamate ligase|nr:RimK family alpha-L-glutamate ligase [Candidatus Woesearchaeota archaeon]